MIGQLGQLGLLGRLGGGGGALNDGYAVFRPIFAGASGFCLPSYTDAFRLGQLWQDSAMTTPVTAVGQAIGAVRDPITGVVMIQAGVASLKPILQQDAAGLYYAAHDGFDDHLYSSASIDLSGTSKITVFGGFRKNSDAAFSILAEFSSNWNSNNGTFTMQAPGNSGQPNALIGSKGTTARSLTGTTYTAPINMVVSSALEISTPLISAKINGVDKTAVTDSQGTGNYGNYTVYMGRRGSGTAPFSGRVYSFVLIGKQLSAPDLVRCNNYINSKTGAY